MGPKEREIKRRLRVLEHAGKIGNVRMTCRYFGLSRSTIDRARRPADQELVQLLDQLSRRIVLLLERRGLLIADPERPGYRWFRCYIAGKPRVLNGYS